jgi:hypothetical protein
MKLLKTCFCQEAVTKYALPIMFKDFPFSLGKNAHKQRNSLISPKNGRLETNFG